MFKTPEQTDNPLLTSRKQPTADSAIPSNLLVSSDAHNTEEGQTVSAGFSFGEGKQWSSYCS